MPGKPLYDLCCDHGLIGLSALDQDLTTEIHLVDRSQPVIDTLITRCQNYLTGNSNRHIYCADASTIKIPHEQATVVIAGVGGKTIEAILDGIYGNDVVDHRLILAPLKTAFKLRQYLQEKAWRLVHEELFMERGRYRELMVLERRGQVIEPFGSMLWESSHAQGYFQFLSSLYLYRSQKNPQPDFELLAFEKFRQQHRSLQA